MFITNQGPEKVEYYRKMLQAVGSLSRLFSESREPYLYYRVAENLFCKSFDADNLSRSDTSADASLGRIGIGLKTFLRASGNKFEKVAEFNNDSPSFRNLRPEQQIVEIARLRNERIETTKNIYGLDEMIYHCVARARGKMFVVEQPMHTIDVDSIHDVEFNDKRLRFSDHKEQYSFYISKSTLFKRFDASNPVLDVSIDILDDPFALLENLFEQEHDLGLVFRPVDVAEDHVFLPLYSLPRGIQTERVVPEKSGLNQWNAAGRARNYDEVYIPIPAYIHNKFPDFFSPRDQTFSMQLPNKKFLSAKVCQDGGKALMSDPNANLGKWILRDVLSLGEGELLTYDKLRDIGLDSVVIHKQGEGKYRIDFAKIGSYETFKNNNPLSE